MKDRINRLMREQQMSQKEFAKELCVAEATVSGIFNGRTRPTNAIVSAIHERFPEVSIQWLMFGEGPMYVSEKESHSTIPSSANESTIIPINFSESHSASDIPQNTPSNIPIVREMVKYVDKPQRKITEIKVFFDDGTFETFSNN